MKTLNICILNRFTVVKNYMELITCILLSLLILNSCSKIEREFLKEETISTLKNQTVKRTSDNSAETTISSTSFTLTSPLRDILQYNPAYLNKIQQSGTVTINSGGGGENFHCCNGICLTVPTNPNPGTYYYPYDAYGNRIQYIGQYGPDEREIYYVYLPADVTENSPIVLLVPGGGWFSGQDISALGFPYNWGSSSNVSIVNDLLNNGYVVVSMIYRLVQLGNNQSEFTSNPIGWQNQIDDITLAVNHIRSNFSTCLWGTTLNANEIHLLGESAGGQLALMYAYTHANQLFLHSVISMYAPTNLQTMDNWIKNIPSGSTFYCTSPPSFFTTFSINFSFDCGGHIKLNPKQFPYNWVVDYNQNNITNNIYYNTCVTSNLDLTNGTPNGQENHIYPGHNLFQSARQNIINNPLNDANLYQFSPRYAINVGAYPTFIMHGREDIIAPYDESTDGMQNALNNSGGVYFQDFVIAANMPSNYTVPHLIRKYCKANHGWTSIDTAYQSSLRNRIRQDAIIWLNNH